MKHRVIDLSEQALSFERDLAAILQDHPVPATGWGQRARRTILAAACVLALAGAGVIAFVQQEGPQLQAPASQPRRAAVRPISPPLKAVISEADRVQPAPPMVHAEIVDAQESAEPGTPVKRRRSAAMAAAQRQRPVAMPASFRKDNEAAMFAKAEPPEQPPSARANEKGEDRDDDTSMRQKRAARLEALDAVRALRLR